MSFRIIKGEGVRSVTSDELEIEHSCDICHQSKVTTNSVIAPNGWFLTGYCLSQLCCGVCAVERTDVCMITPGLLNSRSLAGPSPEQKVLSGPHYRKATK